ncbi:hypothetical protein RYH73_25640 [Olivibacter sp. CPCC 100613]|uniref:hypothetical protein n=1 Tax=Olivibacter sp. CPCC 100613 TaxID=3079931 RepID=UPI002FF46B0F
MTIEEKLDQIINHLKDIDEKFSFLPINTINPNRKREDTLLKPTSTQLKNQRVVELANRMDRKSFLKYIRNNIVKIIEQQNADTNWELIFVPQSLEWFPKFRLSNALFYQDLKKRTKLFAAIVGKEGKALILKLRKQRGI